MRVLALVGNKGGAGKTTLAINLASALNQRQPTLLLDADPQGSSLQWRDIAAEPLLEVEDGSVDLAKRLEEAVGYHYCVIDCPPSVQSAHTRSALRLSQMALIPVQPSPLDLWASVHIEAEVEQARLDNPGLRAMLVLNQVEPRTRLSQQAHAALGELGLPVARTTIRRRVAHRNAVLQGRSVLQMGSRGIEAATELQALIEELGL